MSRSEVIDAFGKVFYQDRGYSRLNWRGVPIVQYPTDLMVIADLLWRVRPQVVVDCGTYAGGLALFIADMLVRTDGAVLTIDVADWSGPGGYPDHPRIVYLRGSSTDEWLVEYVTAWCKGKTCMVILDSDHSEPHVTAEMNAYGPLVSVGSYLIVEDTNVHDVMPNYGLGPDDAVDAWLPDHPEFVVDRDCERLLLTANPGGYLRRVR